MKILFLAAANSSHTVKWVNALSENQNNQVFLAYNSENDPYPGEISDKVQLCPLKFKSPYGYYLNALKVNRLFKKIKPDVVNTHYASGYGTLARVAKVKPNVLSFWGSDIYEFPYNSERNKNIILKNILSSVLVASSSNCMKEEILKVGKDLSFNVEVVPFGVDLRKFNPDLFDTQKDKDKIKIGFVKSLKAVYGVDYFLKAIRILLDDLVKDKKTEIAEKIIVDIYGDGEEEENIVNLSKELNLSNKVNFKGRVSNDLIPKVLSGFDLFCATSNRESFGVALIEAMAMELAVVATDAEGFLEVIEDNVTGLIVEKMNPSSIAKGLETLVLDDSLREKMGKAGRKRAKELYDWEQNVAKMQEIYTKVANDFRG